MLCFRDGHEKVNHRRVTSSFRDTGGKTNLLRVQKPMFLNLDIVQFYNYCKVLSKHNAFFSLPIHISCKSTLFIVYLLKCFNFSGQKQIKLLKHLLIQHTSQPLFYSKHFILVAAYYKEI